MPSLMKVAIVHYRVGRTDGVSLEIEKRKYILKSMGYDVKLISGPLQKGADFVIDELEFERPDILNIKENSFRYFGMNTLSPVQLERKIFSISKEIENKFINFYKKEKFDIIFVHNIFSLGLHLPAASAFTRIASQLITHIIATHHDYYWERKEYEVPTSDIIQDYIEKYLPPPNNNIVHVCINSLARMELKKRRGIDAIVSPDVFNFDQKPWTVDSYNSDFLEEVGVGKNDLFILQATRIVERKGIELAVHYVKEFERQKSELIGKRLFNGKIFTQDSDIVLIIAGYPEKFDQPYLKRLKKEINRKGIKVKFIHKMIDAQRHIDMGKKIYSIWDTYVFADLITYPSLLEGWGNQFIEAIYFKKPIILFEYPVFTADIKKEGYDIISLGNRIKGRNDLGLATISNNKLKAAVKNTIRILTSEETPIMLQYNYDIGSRLHGYSVLKQFIKKQIDLATQDSRP